MNRTKRIWPWVWGILGLGLVVRTAVRDRGVIYDHLEFGRRLFSGADLYAPFLDAPRPLHPVYPPSFGLMTWPFTWLPDEVARTLWAVLQVAALAGIGVWLARLLVKHWPDLAPRVHVTLFATALLASRYVLRDTHGGGGNVINLALVLGALHLASRQRDLFAACVLGASLATKPTGVLFVPLLWMFGYRRAAVLSLVVAGSLLGLALGIHGNGIAPLETWLHGTLAYGRMTDLFAAPEGGFPPFSWMNQCMRCAVVRFFGEVPPHFVEQVPGFVPGLGLGHAATTWIRHALTVSILGATFWVAWRHRDDETRRPMTIAALFAASLLLSPISWKAHHVALLPALFFVAIHAMRGRLWAWAFAGIYAVSCVAGEELVGKQFKNVQQSWYFVTFGTIALWIACLARRPFGDAVQ